MMIFKRKSKALLYDFLLGKEKNYNRLYINDIWNFTNEQLEQNHQYIQWIFPLKERSQFNFSAPLVKDIDLVYNQKVKNNMKKSLIVMLNFYGLDLKDNEIVRTNHYDNRVKCWCTKNNHNFLRITRILKSLCLFNMDIEANLFFNALTKIYEENNDIISNKTFLYWKSAVNKS